jgi:hypothetical protein
VIQDAGRSGKEFLEPLLFFGEFFGSLVGRGGFGVEAAWRLLLKRVDGFRVYFFILKIPAEFLRIILNYIIILFINYYSPILDRRSLYPFQHPKTEQKKEGVRGILSLTFLPAPAHGLQLP